MDRGERWPLGGAQHAPSLAGPMLPAEDARPPRRRAWRVLATCAALVVVAVIIASFVQIPYYALTPGAAIDVATMVKVPARVRQHHPGAIYMTDVTLVPLRAIDYLFYRFNGDDAVLPNAQILGPLTAAQYDAEGAIDMANARQAATVVALSTLGYPVRAVANGAIVYEPLPRSGASPRLIVGDVITAIAGRPTTTLADLTRALAPLRPGETVTVSLRGVPGSGVAVAAHRQRVRLGETRSVRGAFACLAPGTNEGSAPPPSTPRACLGVVVQQRYRTVGLPFAVGIDSEGIIGPSAGLAFTLGLIDELDGNSLTGGRRVAATGTMSVDGTVGDVGGVAQKAVAARRAGAQVFFVPPPEYGVAKAHAGPKMRVEAVATLQQAVRALERLGGSLRARATAR